MLTAFRVNDWDASSSTVTSWSAVPGGLTPSLPASMLFSTASSTFAKKS